MIFYRILGFLCKVLTLSALAKEIKNFQLQMTKSQQNVLSLCCNLADHYDYIKTLLQHGICISIKIVGE